LNGANYLNEILYSFIQGLSESNTNL